MTGTKKTNPFAFITYDGTDETGTRAEVFVQTNKGTIKEIKENAEKKVADVHFSVPNLKFPIHGWIRTDNPLYSLIQTALEAQEEITFRIETQRKPKVDRSIPMETLRADASSARDNVRVILVGINGTLSDEAVTNPAEDPKTTAGRYVATESDMVQTPTSMSGTAEALDLDSALEAFAAVSANSDVRSTVLDAMAAQLLLQGATVEQINEAISGSNKRDTAQPELRPNFSVEAPAWKDYNSDGRLNLGSSIIAAGVGVETLIFDRVSQAMEDQKVDVLENLDDIISYYCTIVFAICDRVQEVSYGQGFRSDRAAQSHVRIRGIVYEMVKKNYPLPFHIVKNGNVGVAKVDGKAHDEWVKNVGREGIKRFARAISISTQPADFKTPLPVSLVNNASVAPQKVESQPVVKENIVAPTSEPVMTSADPVQEAPADNVANVETERHSKEDALKAASDIIKKGEATQPVSESFFQEILSPDMVEGEELATPETIDRFKTTLANLGLNIADSAEQARIAKLLKFTFGENYTNARKIPDVILEGFIDYYESAGTEALDSAIREALK